MNDFDSMKSKSCPIQKDRDGGIIVCSPACGFYVDNSDYEICSIHSIAVSLHDITIHLSNIENTLIPIKSALNSIDGRM